MKRLHRPLILLAALAWGCATTPVPIRYDAVIRNGLIYDGSGSAPRKGDVAITGDTIAAVGDIGSGRGSIEIDAHGRAVAPGFINMLSWANESLIVDGRSQSDIHQGVTLEVMGEGWSMGPLTEAMKREARERQTDFKYDIEWTTLGEYLDDLVRRGISPNVASFVGAATVRIHELGYENRPPTAPELERMKDLVRQAMREGALGVGLAPPPVVPGAGDGDQVVLASLEQTRARRPGLATRTHVPGHRVADRAEVEDPERRGPIGHLRQRRLDHRLGLGPRNQHRGADLEAQAPELLLAQNVGDGLARQATTDESLQSSLLTRG